MCSFIKDFIKDNKYRGSCEPGNFEVQLFLVVLINVNSRLQLNVLTVEKNTKVINAM